MTTPLVSVIMPAFNARTTIVEAIDSALSQTHPEIEVVVVDDGSEDGTADLVAGAFGDRVVLVRAPHAGRGTARNLGLAKATGDYVQYLDADDSLQPQKVAAQVAFLEEHPDIAVAYGDVEAFRDSDPQDRWLFGPGPRPEGDILPFILDAGIILTLGALVRRDWSLRVSGFDPELESNEDWDHWLKIAAHGGRFAYHPSDGFVGSYRVRGEKGGPDRAPLPHLRSGLQVLENLDSVVGRERAASLRLDRSIGRWRFGYGRSLLLEGDRAQGLKEMWRGLVADRRYFRLKLSWLVLGALLGGTRTKAIIDLIRPDAEQPKPTPGGIRILAVTQAFVVPGNRVRWERLAELHPDVDVTLVTPARFRETRYGAPEDFRTLAEERGNYRVVPMQVSNRFGTYRSVARVLRRYRPNIVHIFDEPTEWMLLQWFLAGRLVVPDAKRLFYYYTNILDAPKKPRQRAKTSAIFRLADGAYVGSTGAERVLRQLGYRGPLRIQTALGADEQRWVPTEARSPEGFTVGYLGSLVPQKGVDDLVRAVAELKEDCKLVIGGDGIDRPRLERLVKDLGVRDRVRFEGMVNRAAAPDFMRRLDVLVLPSRTAPPFREQFGLVLVEGMLSGLPVIGSDSGAIHEVIEDAGLIYPEGDSAALASVLRNLQEGPNERRALANKGRERALRLYSATALANETYRLYGDLIAR